MNMSDENISFALDTVPIGMNAWLVRKTCIRIRNRDTGTRPRRNFITAAAGAGRRNGTPS